MKKMVYKYVYFNGKNILLGVFTSLLFGLIAFDRDQYYSVALLMIPSLLFHFVVGKLCYEEDSRSTGEFLLALPITKKDVVWEKNIIGQICIVVGFSIVNVMFFMTNLVRNRADQFFDMRMILILGCLLIVYQTIYICLNYKFDYSKTQLSSYIILALMLVLFKFGNEFACCIGKLNVYVLFIAVAAFSSVSFWITKMVSDTENS